MCGITGIINPSKFYKKDMKKAACEMVFADTLRGRDSTGMFSVKDNRVDWRKIALPAYEFLNLDSVTGFINGLNDASFIVGHNRASTSGKSITKNAHPFECGHITLVHNGTVFQQGLLDKTKDMEVDSNMIAHTIYKRGIDYTAPKITGGHSLVWFDSKEKTLNFLRNSERPMWILETNDLIFFASEYGIARWIALRNGFEPLKTYATKEHVLYSIKEGERIFTERPMEKYEFSSAGRSFRSYIGSAWRDDDTCGYEQEAEETSSKESEAEKEKAEVSQPTLRKEVERALEIGRVEFLRSKYTIGKIIHFSLSDYNDKVATDKFIPIEGELLPDTFSKDSEQCVIKGNYGGSIKDLENAKTLLVGEITYLTYGRAQGKVFIQVKDIKLSAIEDPFLQKVNKSNFAKDVEAAKRKACEDCSSEFGVSGVSEDVPHLISEGGKMRVLCFKCMNAINATVQ